MALLEILTDERDGLQMLLNCVINDSSNILLHISRQVFWTDDGFFSIRPIWKYFGKIWLTYKTSFPVSLDINI